MIEEKIAQSPAPNSVEQVLGQIANAARVDNVFGQPIEREGTIVIPFAEIAVGWAWEPAAARRMSRDAPPAVVEAVVAAAEDAPLL